MAFSRGTIDCASFFQKVRRVFGGRAITVIKRRGKTGECLTALVFDYDSINA
jgi:hypothetical protein